MPRSRKGNVFFGVFLFLKKRENKACVYFYGMHAILAMGFYKLCCIISPPSEELRVGYVAVFPPDLISSSQRPCEVGHACWLNGDWNTVLLGLHGIQKLPHDAYFQTVNYVVHVCFNPSSLKQEFPCSKLTCLKCTWHS